MTEINSNNSTNFAKGLVAQNLVQSHLKSLNFALIRCNFQFYFGRKMGEIDLIMQKNNRIHLIEVKMRTLKNSKFGRINEQITKTKLLTLAKSWQFFLLKNPEFKNHFCQFDAAFVWQKNLNSQNLQSFSKNPKTQKENQIFQKEIQNKLESENLELEIIFNAYQFDF